MPNDSMIPRPPSLRDIRRDQEDEARRREQATSARNTSSSTIGAGGMLTLDGGGLDVVNGGNGRIRDGGKWSVEGGGSMDITDDGQINAVGEGRHRFTREIVKVTASLANRLMTNLWESVTYLQAGLYFNTGGESRGALDPRVVSEDGKSVSAISSAEKMMYGPQVGPNIMAKSTYKAGPEHASIGAYAWDDSVNPGGGDGDTGRRGAGTVAVTPYDLSILLSNYTDGPDGIPSGPAFWINGTLEEGKLNIYTRNGLDVQGTFTVNGQPVGGGTWDSITGKPTTFPPSSHTHSIANVTNLQTTLDGKAASTHGHNNATTTAPGFMSPTDKGKLDGATANPTANTVMYRDAWGRAQISDPVGASDIANKRAVDAKAAPMLYRKVPGTSLPGTLTATYSPFAGAVTVPADPFGAGVPYVISVYAQVQTNVPAGATIVTRILFNGAQPNGAKVNGGAAPNFSVVSVQYDFDVTTSMAVSVLPQASSQGVNSTIGSGADAPFFTVKVTPFNPL